jgi:hypothetical protein
MSSGKSRGIAMALSLSMLLCARPLGACEAIRPKNPVRTPEVCGYAQDPIGGRIADLGLKLVTSDDTMVSEVHTDKGFSYRVMKDIGSNMEIWQKGFSDHRIRDAEDYRLHLAYARQNPVRKHLCERPENYLYSSANPRFQLDEVPQGLKPASMAERDGAPKDAPLQVNNTPGSAKDAPLQINNTPGAAEAAPFKAEPCRCEASQQLATKPYQVKTALKVRPKLHNAQTH